ncbi:lysine-rich nucleolar protein 1 isoform X1 [Acanthopagrus latus]|uniref:lysine-rich nucleolar protein 1 isoform X1 n=2 Tax=Acanthopagrus latus TaxID=8177 RepID=UPI00187C54F5|nr:lysine-rich nucleolar protein 1 isoform X1 [Acanthopagrus latus]
MTLCSCDKLVSFVRLSVETDSDEDVIFVAEKCVAKSHEIAFDQVKRLALQRDIDEQSQPIQPTKPLTSQTTFALERPVEKVKMKMEEEKSKEGFVKKQKKPKKEQASLPKTENCNFNDGSLEEVKKEKKKAKKVDAAVTDLEEESLGGGDERELKKKKKKRKIETESLNNANGFEVKNENDGEVSKKKKKKKLLADGGNQVESSVNEEVEKKQRKEKKLKNVSVQTISGNVKTEKEEEEESGGLDKLPKKAKKVKNNALFVSTEKTEEEPREKKKKKKKKAIHEETAEAVDEIIVTKKKKKAKTNVTESQLKSETPGGEVKEVKKKKKKGANEVESETVPIEEDKTELRMKGKKHKSRKAAAEVGEVEEMEPNKKKRKKGNSKGDGEVQHSLICEEIEEQIRENLVIVAEDTTRKTKKKKISIKVEAQVEDVSLETGAKKKKKMKKKVKEEVEDQHESAQVDVVFLSEKSGNKDEVNINQERRQALQMEVDQASQPQRPARPTGLGQWSTAQFNNSDQQQKFLRLMGGFKKGFQPAAGRTGSTNMALGKDAQQQLQQGLLGEFERAQSRRLDFNNRGAGLGFSAPSNKKFSIDVHACRSVRFDD